MSSVPKKRRSLLLNRTFDNKVTQIRVKESVFDELMRATSSGEKKPEFEEGGEDEAGERGEVALFSFETRPAERKRALGRPPGSNGSSSSERSLGSFLEKVRERTGVEVRPFKRRSQRFDEIAEEEEEEDDPDRTIAEYANDDSIDSASLDDLSQSSTVSRSGVSWSRPLATFHDLSAKKSKSARIRRASANHIIVFARIPARHAIATTPVSTGETVTAKTIKNKTCVCNNPNNH